MNTASTPAPMAGHGAELSPSMEKEHFFPAGRLVCFVCAPQVSPGVLCQAAVPRPALHTMKSCPGRRFVGVQYKISLVYQGVVPDDLRAVTASALS